MTINPKPLPWYREGLKFQCTQCGKCCTGSPGYIWVNEEEIAQMARFLNIPVDLFKRRYLKQRNNRYALVEKRNLDCVFLENKKCKVYGARPLQCRTFPFWKENVNSEESWSLTARQCEGIHENAETISFEDIQKQLNLENNKE